VSLQVTTIMLGVKDLARPSASTRRVWAAASSRTVPISCFNLGEGSSSLALYPWYAVAGDAGVSPDGTGFRGASFHYLVASNETVDEVMGQEVAAGASVVKEVVAAQWGYFGYFGDPDGHLWKVAAG
jgi:catechol 2,3-dioxygenase-like lactoylglutathione lyase family enzyme